jgi:uncharacterized protein (DUF433 family)
VKPKKKTPARRARSKETAEGESSARVREEATQARPVSARERITVDPAVMGGRPCIRGMRVTVGTILGLLAKGHSRAKVLKLYPYLKTEDIDAVETCRTLGGQVQTAKTRALQSAADIPA